MKKKNLILEVKKETSNGTWKYEVLEQYDVEALKENSCARFYFHKHITECFDRFVDADFDNPEEVYRECDEYGEEIDGAIYYVIERAMHEVISSKDYDKVNIDGRCAKGHIYLYTKEVEEDDEQHN